MRKIIVAEFVSFDGVMQAPGGAEEDTEGDTIDEPAIQDLVRTAVALNAGGKKK